MMARCRVLRLLHKSAFCFLRDQESMEQVSVGDCTVILARKRDALEQRGQLVKDSEFTGGVQVEDKLKLKYVQFLQEMMEEAQTHSGV